MARDGAATVGHSERNGAGLEQQLLCVTPRVAVVEPHGLFAKVCPAGVTGFPQPVDLGCPGLPVFSGLVFGTSLLSPLVP